VRPDHCTRGADQRTSEYTYLKSLDLTDAALVTESFEQLVAAIEKNDTLTLLIAKNTALTDEQVLVLKKVCDQKNIDFDGSSPKNRQTL